MHMHILLTIRNVAAFLVARMTAERNAGFTTIAAGWVVSSSLGECEYGVSGSSWW